MECGSRVSFPGPTGVFDRRSIRKDHELMNRTTRRLLSWLPLLAVVGALAACGERSKAAASSTLSIHITAPKEGWARTIDYRTDERGVPNLTVDGIRFELRDPAAYRLDWEAIGMKGISTSSTVHYQSTQAVEGAFLAVSGKGVEIHDGVLSWGTVEVGKVAAGDVVVVDADGVRIRAK
jgi:hypothetical protein